MVININTDLNDRYIIFDDLIKLSKKIVYPQVVRKDLFNIWKEKIDYLEKYYNSIYSNDIYDFNYFRGLSDISLNIIKNIDFSQITYGLSINRFYNIKTIFDIYNPNNIKYSPIINSFSEYIKHEFFYNNKKRVEYYKIFDMKLNIEDYYYFIARLIFPTYYFDLFKDNKIKMNYELIVNNINDYISNIKDIFTEIKKRHINMPFIDYVINLL